MGRTGYYLKPGTKPTAPSSVFTVVIDPIVTPASTNETMFIRTFGKAAATYSKFRRGKWSDLEVEEFSDAAELWRWIERTADSQRRNYCLAPIASDVLTLAYFWEEVSNGANGRLLERRGECRRGNDLPAVPQTLFRRLVVRGRPDIVDYARDQKRYLWLSGIQYLPVAEDDIARSLGYEWAETPHRPNTGESSFRKPLERAVLWSLAFRRIVDWWRDESNAPWGLTVGALSVGMLRTHLAPKSLCTHKDEEAHRLELAAQFGGRASTWYFADVIGVDPKTNREVRPPTPPTPFAIKGPVALWDVASMYPSLLRDRTFPVKLVSRRGEVPVKTLIAACELMPTIATVTIRTLIAEYPYRVKNDVLYPIGEFTTTLTSPEILKLLSHGDIVKCHAMAMYQAGQPFAPAAGELISLRTKARCAGDNTAQLFAKLLSNSLGGKLAQKKGGWVSDPKAIAEREWGEWHKINAQTGESVRYRATAGQVYRYEKKNANAGPFGAAFAFLTAYGRLMMREIREMLPPESVLSQDTDGLWVTADGSRAIRESGQSRDREAGSLRLERLESAARWFGPRHYWTPSHWTLAGFRHPAVVPESLTLTHTLELNPVTGSVAFPPHHLLTVDRTARLSFDRQHLAIAQTGWSAPPYVGPQSTSG